MEYNFARGLETQNSKLSVMPDLESFERQTSYKRQFKKEEHYLGGVRIYLSTLFTHRESSKHLFISCPMVSKIWFECYRWMSSDFAIVLPENLSSHFWLHSAIARSKAENLIWNIIWCYVIWCLWKKRNNYLFNQATGDVLCCHWRSNSPLGLDYILWIRDLSIHMCNGVVMLRLVYTVVEWNLSLDKVTIKS